MVYEYFIVSTIYRPGNRDFHRTVCVTSLKKACDIAMNTNTIDVFKNKLPMNIYYYKGNELLKTYNMHDRILGITDNKDNFIPRTTVLNLFNEENLPYFEDILKDTKVVYGEPILYPLKNPLKDNTNINIVLQNVKITFQNNKGYNDKLFKNLISF